MSITYPPEMLPLPDDDDDAEVVVSCGCAEPPCERCIVIKPAYSTSERKSPCGTN